jgi:hypothetical protein
MILAFILCAVPTLANIFFDRNGRKKEHKIWIKLIVIAISLALAVVVKVAVDIDCLRSLTLMWGIYFLTFDYGVTYVLHKRGIIEGKDSEKWWKYMGESTHWYDQAAAKIPWVLRLFIRIIIFAVFLYAFLQAQIFEPSILQAFS